MKTRIAWTLFAASLAALLWLGCDDEDYRRETPPRSPVESIQIVTGTTNDPLVTTDTLWFAPGDSASTTVTVIVTDYYGHAVAGMKVDLSLANASLGVIEYVDETLRDTTNSVGRVNAVFRSYAQAGDQIITATAGGATSNRVLVIRPRSQGIRDGNFGEYCIYVATDSICFDIPG
ncbi:MAG: hypothetical protein KDB65_06415 [Calditrichaeota bacterium]|nr:hypothetical protein [Calditrichota bacterium]MCB9369774.1 hypothetical protein [Calditrichota bacterium]